MNMASQDKVKRNKDTGNAFVRYMKSFFHALSGIKYAILKEHNMIIILLAMIVTIIAGIYFKISATEWLFCILSIGLVAATEMINTSIEALVDLVSPEYHVLAKISKDTASSATLIFSITSFIGALVIFLPKITEII